MIETSCNQRVADGVRCTRELFHDGICNEVRTYGRRWCNTCQARVQIVDESVESEPSPLFEHEVAVTHMACGHDIQVRNGRSTDVRAYEPL